MSFKTRGPRAAALAAAMVLLAASCSSTPAGTATARAPSAATGSPAQTEAPSEIPEPSTISAPTAEGTEKSAENSSEQSEAARSETSGKPVAETFPEQTVDTESPNALAVLAKIDKALLTPQDLGSGFVQGTYAAPDPSDTGSTLPCGQVNTSVAFPNALRTGTVLTLGQSAQVQQAVSYFLDEETASAAFSYAVAGISCTDANVGGTAATVSEPQDVTADVGGGTAIAWTVQIGTDSAVLIAVLRGSTSVGYTFAVPGNSDVNTLPNPVEVVALATQKLIAAGL